MPAQSLHVRRFRFCRGASVPVGAALLCLFGACATTPPQSMAPRTADARTAAHVQAALATDQRLAGREIKASVEGGLVHLSGIVHSTRDLLRVQDDVLSVPGVTGVDEGQLVIVPGGTPP